MKIFSWEIEDTFFGAILGAFLGTFIDSLPITSILMLVCFFILFPVILRKTYIYPKYALVIANLFHVLWIILFVYDLHEKKIISLEKGAVLIIIFIGWIISKNLRLVT